MNIPEPTNLDIIVDYVMPSGEDAYVILPFRITIDSSRFSTDPKLREVQEVSLAKLQELSFDISENAAKHLKGLRLILKNTQLQQ